MPAGNKRAGTKRLQILSRERLSLKTFYSYHKAETEPKFAHHHLYAVILRAGTAGEARVDSNKLRSSESELQGLLTDIVRIGREAFYLVLRTDKNWWGGCTQKEWYISITIPKQIDDTKRLTFWLGSKWWRLSRISAVQSFIANKRHCLFMLWKKTKFHGKFSW